MYTELLKELYCKERLALEDMQVFKQEAKLKFLRFKRESIEKVEGRISIPEIDGRNDIAEEVKDALLRDADNEDKVKDRLDKLVGDNFAEIDNEEEQELKNANYSAAEFAEYVFQMEKVAAIEAELENNRLFPEAVYEMYKEAVERKTK